LCQIWMMTNLMMNPSLHHINSEKSRHQMVIVMKNRKMLRESGQTILEEVKGINIHLLFMSWTSTKMYLNVPKIRACLREPTSVHLLVGVTVSPVDLAINRVVWLTAEYNGDETGFSHTRGVAGASPVFFFASLIA
jgi:hypothetical protein